jgi:MraZ protein
MRFMGTHRPKLDDKGRLFLPAKFRGALAEGVVVTQGHENCLVVWPPEVFEEESVRVRERPMASKSGRGFIRTFFSGAEEAVPDKQGRISISQELRSYAGLEGEVAVIGVHDRLEIWDPTKWREYQAAEAEKFADLDEDDE